MSQGPPIPTTLCQIDVPKGCGPFSLCPGAASQKLVDPKEGLLPASAVRLDFNADQAPSKGPGP